VFNYIGITKKMSSNLKCNVKSNVDETSSLCMKMKRRQRWWWWRITKSGMILFYHVNWLISDGLNTKLLFYSHIPACLLPKLMNKTKIHSVWLNQLEESTTESPKVYCIYYTCIRIRCKEFRWYTSTKSGTWLWLTLRYS